MNLSAVAEGFSRWIDAAANAILTLSDRWAVPHVIKLHEESRGEFVVQTDNLARAEKIRITESGFDCALPAELAAVLPGGRVELNLLANQLLFRQIELPARASEFLDGILRAQIDSLTPWNAAECAYGWGKPTQIAGDRIVVNVAAGALASIRPYARALSDAGAHSISMYAMPQETNDSTPIKIWEARAQGSVKLDKVRRLLFFILIATGIIAATAGTTSILLSASLDAEQEQLAEQIGRVRIAAGAKQDREARSETAALNRLMQRKQDWPLTVMVLEDLSRLLPDHTYLTELRADGKKLRISGVTRDAPSLVGLLEQSGRFSEASFFAPTTRNPASPGERFHIEATIHPVSDALR